MNLRTTYFLGLLVLAAAPFLTGCGTLAHLFQGDSVDPIYQPQDRPTLVITEQDEGPSGPVLSDPSLSGVVTAQAIFQLKNEEVIHEFVPPEKVAEVQKKYGDKYKSMPYTAVAREVGAQQVLIIRVRSASVATDPGVLRPKAVVFLWLADAITDQVLFPAPGSGNDAVAPEAQTGPYVLAVELQYESPRGGENSNAMNTNLTRALAERIGRDSARVFFSYIPDSPNSP
jgi:hypothetical protein